MLKSLKMTGFRAFEAYTLDSLSRVNLVVGKNNSGKTSVLEAVDLLVSSGSPGAIAESAQRRAEMRSVEWRSPGFGRVPSIAHLFYGHACEPGARFELRGPQSSDRVSVELRSLDELDDEILSDLLGGFDDRLPPEASPAMALAITPNVRKGSEFFPVTEEGLLLRDLRRRWEPRRSTRFLSLTSMDPPFLAEAWNALVTDGRENEVVEDMKLLVPDIDSIHFLTSGRLSTAGGIVVGLRTEGSRLPLGTFGDGMRRLLLLRLALANNADSYVLVDEIDTGLHWTVMAGMWRLVVEVARNSRLQLFATTHSHDCILGLASMIKSYPDLADQVSIQKIDTSLPQAVSVQGPDIPGALESGVDFR